MFQIPWHFQVFQTSGHPERNNDYSSADTGHDLSGKQTTQAEKTIIHDTVSNMHTEIWARRLHEINARRKRDNKSQGIVISK